MHCITKVLENSHSGVQLFIYSLIGLEFWRCGSRKVYAVREKNLRIINRGKCIRIDSGSSSDESDSSTKKKADISKLIKSIKSSISEDVEVIYVNSTVFREN